MESSNHKREHRASPLNIAFIDDRPLNIKGWLEALNPICEEQSVLSTFFSVDEFEEAIEEGYIPDILFTDYFIESRNGFEAIEIVKEKFCERVYIIAHSAEPWANDLMLAAGADEAVPKYEDQNPSTTIDVRFRTFDDFLELIVGKGFE